jgi:outer membrane murein-binding lipoprotein Lpp
MKRWTALGVAFALVAAVTIVSGCKETAKDETVEKPAMEHPEEAKKPLDHPAH